MKIVLPPVYERKNDPDIDGESDFFQRQGFADNLTKLFKACDEGLVISIDSQWGDGKTSFVLKWSAELEQGGDFVPIYYDAYKSDFTDDAFLSIATAIHEKLKKYNGIERARIGENQLASLRNSMAVVAGDMLKLAAGVAITTFTGGSVNGVDISERAGDAVGKLLVDGLNGRVDQRLTAHAEAHKHIEEYRERLKAAIEALNGKKIVFFIDELDRCRPDFAIKVIEKIKHLFNVKGVFFVLSVNRKQLVSIIMHSYGVSRGDAGLYFQKFINLETKLPTIERAIQKQKNGLRRFVESVFKEHEIDCHKIGDGFPDFLELIGPKKLDLNPRAIERMATLVSIVLTLSEDFSIHEYYLLVCTGAAIRVGDPDYYFNYYSLSDYRGSDGKDKHRCFDVVRKIINRAYGTDVIEGESYLAPFNEITDLIDIFDFPNPPWAQDGKRD